MDVRRVQITDTILRDAHQSLIATRMRIEDMLPAAAALDEAGYFSLEVWGGATFDVCLRFLNECPWQRLEALRKALPKTKLQMLLRGQNLVGYRHYADDIVDAFVEKAREHGIDIFRIFDALNDLRNLTRAMHAAKKVGALVEGTISYTVSPVHTIEQFVRFASSLKDEGADLICIKDMAGMISPESAFVLISALKQEVGLPVHLHTHCASGLAPATFLRAAQAGVNIVDCALSPFSWGTSQPPTESIAALFGEGGYETGLNVEAVYRAAAHFEKVRERYSVILNPRSERVDTGILKHQIPGGMLSNLLSQLAAQGASDKLAQVLDETARVRQDLGYPPLVTPTSQIVGTQAVFNIVGGERYKLVSEEVKDYVRGRYGKAPATIDPAVAKKAIGDEVPIECRPADRLPPELHKAVALAAPFSSRLVDALSCALFPQIGVAFLKARATGGAPPTAEPPPEEMKPKTAPPVLASRTSERAYLLSLGGKQFSASVESVSEVSGGRKFSVALDGDERIEVVLENRGKARKSARLAADSGEADNHVRAPMPGMIVKIMVAVGTDVRKGDVVAILEAMKMQNEIKSPLSGTVSRILAAEGSTLEKDAVIAEIEPGEGERAQ
jgi:pyruvate carboxylase subunit B